MDKRTIQKLFGYTSPMPSVMPQLESKQDKRELGRYTIPQAAAFIAVPQRTMRSWFLGDRRIFTPAFHRGDSVFLSFYDVTEAYVIEVLRSHWDFNPQKLRKALARLRKKTKSNRPLLRAQLSVIPEFQNLVATVPEKGSRVHIDVAHEGNLVFSDFVRTMGVRISRDSRGKPVRIYPWRDNDSDETPVSMDPNVMSGELVVTGTRIPAKTVVAKYASGKSADSIADSYQLNPDLIRKVLLHFEREKSQKVS